MGEHRQEGASLKEPSVASEPLLQGAAKFKKPRGHVSLSEVKTSPRSPTELRGE